MGVPLDVANDLDSAETALAEHLQMEQAAHIPVKLKILRQESYPYSVVRMVKAEGSGLGQNTYYIKRLLVQEQRRKRAADQCRKEAQLLAVLKDRMPAEVVEFVLANPERLITITRACTGVKFSELFRGYFLRQHLGTYKRKLVHISAHCGDWLRRFHATTNATGESLADWIDYQCGEAEWRADELSILDPGNKLFYERIARNLEKDFKRLALPPRSSMIHRDFAPHNIFVNPTHIQVLDFTDTQQGHGAMDVVNFIASLASRCEHRLVTIKLAKTMCAEFLGSYGGLSEEDRQLYKLLLVLQSLKRLLVLHQRENAGFWSRISQNGMRWHLTYLELFIEITGRNEALLAGPWPFLDLNDT